MTGNNMNFSILILNVNVFNAPIKKTTSLESKTGEKFFQRNEPHKTSGVAILIPDTVDFRLKSIRRNN
jgi:hypothetical protein